MLDAFKNRMARQGGSQSNAYLKQSDMIIDATFKRDPAYKRVSLTHAPSDMYNIEYDAKYLVRAYYNITKDEVDYYLQFRPHTKVPIGSYVDIPDDNGDIETWLIVAYDDRPQFPLYYILKCNWTLKWMLGDKVYKVLGCLRNQNSYNSGLWQDMIFESVENQNKFWMPTTPYTQTIEYGQHVLINDVGRATPILWRTSKIEDVQPIGITKLTFVQEAANLHSDCGIHGIAGWCKCPDHSQPKAEICKNCPFEDPVYIDAGLEMPQAEVPRGKITYNGKDATLRVGGSAKTFTAMFWNEFSNDYVNNKPIWKLSYIDGEQLLSSVNLSYTDGLWDIKLADDCPTGITLSQKSDKSGVIVSTLSDNKEIFQVHVSPDKDNIDALKIKCLQLYSMVGKTIVVTAQDVSGQYTTEINMEVVS